MKFEEDTKINILKDDLFGKMIYFLIKNDEVVYVGQSINGIKRPIHHYDKDFDYFTFVNVRDRNKLDELENYYITKYEPKYNKTLNKTKNMISYSEYYAQYYKGKKTKEKYSKIKDIIIQNKLYFQIFKGKMFIEKNNIIKINNLVK